LESTSTKLLFTHLIFFILAYGISPDLNIGFEEAIFLSNKIKLDLGGSLTTEKVLYLLYMTLLRKQKTKGVRGKSAAKKSISTDSDLDRDATTLKAFIIRYLYYLREQSIINQVQKIKSLDEVRKVFRQKASEADLLQFH